MRTSTTRHPTLLRRARAIVAGLALVAGIAAASSTSSDQSDLWWNPAESGTGYNVQVQHGTLVATIFFYTALRGSRCGTSESLPSAVRAATSSVAAPSTVTPAANAFLVAIDLPPPTVMTGPLP
mgnify:CR=1 FL=1